MLFFWETATLIDLMLVGHWVEMRSVMGASKALEELARLMPDEAHRFGPGGDVEDVPTNALQVGDRVRGFSTALRCLSKFANALLDETNQGRQIGVYFPLRSVVGPEACRILRSLPM